MSNDELKTPIESEEPSRRRFLGWIVTGINLAIVAVVAVPAIRFVASPLSKRTKERWVDVLGEDELEVGQTKEVSYSVPVQDGYHATNRRYTAYLHRTPDEVLCFDPACTHLGCRVQFQDDQRRYFCPCHGGVFNEGGQVVSGPPPKGLVRHPVKVEGGRIFVQRKV